MKTGQQQSALRALTQEDAINLHDYFAGRAELAFNYFFDGCAHRTHIMGTSPQLKPFSLKKAWAFAQKRNYLSFTSPSGFTQKWHYHIALCVPVIEEKSGLIRDFIFDPALFDGPVRLKTWKSAIANEHSKFFLLEWGQYPDMSQGDFSPAEKTTSKTTANAIQILKGYAQISEVKRRVVKASPLKKAFAAALTCPTTYNNLHQGNGWISETIYKKPKSLS